MPVPVTFAEGILDDFPGPYCSPEFFLGGHAEVQRGFGLGEGGVESVAERLHFVPAEAKQLGADDRIVQLEGHLHGFLIVFPEVRGVDDVCEYRADFAHRGLLGFCHL